jgi:tRNA(Ile)-lysidine synthase
MIFSAGVLHQALDQYRPDRSPLNCIVALSGGGDSAALLGAAAELRDAGQIATLRALHVDHGLQAAAAVLQERAAAQAAQFAVPFRVLQVRVDTTAGVSMEAAARDARYAAMSGTLGASECLLTAHHAEDQAETLILQALRGAGPKGLAAMPAARRLGLGWHLRPLLAVTRADLRVYAASCAIEWSEDPMNADPRFERAYFRREIWPRLVQRWPAAAVTLSRSAAHLATAQQLLDERADDDLARLGDGPALSIPRLRALDPERRANALRRFIVGRGRLLPSTARLTEALRQILDAEGDHQPAVLWDDAALRRYRDRLYLTAASSPQLAETVDWAPSAQPTLALGERFGALHQVLRLGGLDPGRLPGTLQVRRRRGGERIRPAAGAARQELRHLYQQRGLVPWMRDALPFIYAGHRLVAVADLWIEAELCTTGEGIMFEWRDAPDIY